MKKHSYIEWLSASEMHKNSMQWFSELKFMRDEQFFLNNLVTTYTIKLSASEIIQESKKVIDQLQKAEIDIVPLFKSVQAHENQLVMMVDDVDQPKMEKAYIETHQELIDTMQKYRIRYREIKEKMFKLISRILKKSKPALPAGKQKPLLN